MRHMMSSTEQQQPVVAGAAATQRPAPDKMAPAPPQLPAPLPGHLQHAVHKALGDLQAMRLLYPQQCTAAEREGESLQGEAERWVVPRSLGPRGAPTLPARLGSLHPCRSLSRCMP